MACAKRANAVSHGAILGTANGGTPADRFPSNVRIATIDPGLDLCVAATFNLPTPLPLGIPDILTSFQTIFETKTEAGIPVADRYRALGEWVRALAQTGLAVIYIESPPSAHAYDRHALLGIVSGLSKLYGAIGALGGGLAGLDVRVRFASPSSVPKDRRFTALRDTLGLLGRSTELLYGSRGGVRWDVVDAIYLCCSVVARTKERAWLESLT